MTQAFHTMKHFVKRLEEYSEDPEAKATGTVGPLTVVCHALLPQHPPSNANTPAVINTCSPSRKFITI